MKYSASQRNKLSTSRSDQDEVERLSCRLMLGSMSMSAEVSYPGPGQNATKICSNDFHRTKIKISCLIGGIFSLLIVAMLKSGCQEMVGMTRLDWAGAKGASASENSRTATTALASHNIDELCDSRFLRQVQLRRPPPTTHGKRIPTSRLLSSTSITRIHHGTCCIYRWLEF